MVERSRELRDRAFLATLFLVGGAALASGLVQMFWLGLFLPGSEFSALLGGAILLVTALFETPYRDPSLVGLPGPGLHFETRKYLRYPVPVPDALGPTPGAVQVSIADAEPLPILEPDWKEEPAPAPRPTVAPPAVVATPKAVAPAPSVPLVPFPSPSPPTTAAAPRPAPPVPSEPLVSSRTNRAVLEARQAIAALEALGTLPPAGPGVTPVQKLPPIDMRPILPDHAPPADYLEDHLPHQPPAVDPGVQASLADLAHLAGTQAHGETPLALVNGKPPEATLSDIEQALLQAPPLETGAATAPPEPGPLPQTSDEALHSVERAEVELRSMPPVESVVVPPAEVRPSAPAVAGARPSSPAPEGARAPFVEVPGLEAEPISEPLAELNVPPIETPSTPPPEEMSAPESPAEAPVPPVVAETSEASLENMAKALEGMISQSKGAVATAPPETSEVRVPPPTPVPKTLEGDVGRPGRASAARPASPPTSDIDDLSRQLEAMKSALLAPAGPVAGLPPPVAKGPAKPAGSASRSALADLPPPPSPPASSVELGEDDLQKVLDQATDAARETTARHVDTKSTTGPSKKRRSRNGADPPAK